VLGADEPLRGHYTVVEMQLTEVGGMHAQLVEGTPCQARAVAVHRQYRQTVEMARFGAGAHHHQEHIGDGAVGYVQLGTVENV